jgi:hypothetical protein
MLTQIDLNLVASKQTEHVPEEYKDMFFSEITDDGFTFFGFYDDELLKQGFAGSPDGKCYTHWAKEISSGVYETDINFVILLDSAYETNSYLHELVDSILGEDKSLHSRLKYFNKYSEFYGVADNWEQVLQIKTWFTKIKKYKFILTFSKMRRENQEESGGWRYHKWGEYIGTQNPQHEYLYDDKHIDEVIIYHFIGILGEK